MTTSSIVLTDWPKTKHVEAHYRGCDTADLHQKHELMFHLMLCSLTEVMGGYAITYEYKAVIEELKFRKEKPKYADS